MIHMEPRYWKIVKDILQKYPYTFYAFGSRVKGTQRKLSDLDICYMEKIPGNILSHTDEDFENSDLPFEVDIVNWNTCDDASRAKNKTRFSLNSESIRSTYARMEFYITYIRKASEFLIKRLSQTS